MSVVKNVYDAIIAELDTITEIKTTGKWNNQILRDEEEVQFEYPAVYVDINVTWLPHDVKPESTKDNRKYQQKGNSTITFHILDKRLEETSATFGDIQDVAKLVWDKMAGFDGEDFGPLMRTDSVDDTDHDIVRDWQEIYTCLLEEQPTNADVVDAAPVTVSLDAGYSTGPYLDE